MQKSLVRDLCVHYGYRWAIMRHNLRNDEQWVTPYDRYILDHLQPGVTTACEYIGNQYAKLVPGINIDSAGPCDNLIAANSTFYKYRTLDQIGELLTELGTRLNPQGRLFAGFNFQFVNFNRLKFDFAVELATMLDATQFEVIGQVIRAPEQTNPYGNNFFILQKHEQRL
jgi:hypothetical protein